mgnify:CR=1 FL=1
MGQSFRAGLELVGSQRAFVADASHQLRNPLTAIQIGAGLLLRRGQLGEMTGEAQFKQFADANFGALVPQWGPSMWEVDALDSVLYYAQLPGATPEVAKSIRERFMANLSRASEGTASVPPAPASTSRRKARK